MLVYLHIPFCHKLCPYCSFYKHTAGRGEPQRLVRALLREAQSHLAELGGHTPRTLYLGGGTPSLLAPQLVTELLVGLAQLIDFSRLEEICLEANPATFDQTKAELWRHLGVTRVSLGVQSLDRGVLQTLGRDHAPEDAIRAFDLLRQAGLAAINIDLMYSIPGQSVASWQRTLEAVIALKPDHVSAYNLTFEEDTEFLRALEQGHFSTDQERDAEHFECAVDLLEAAGFEHYETSNFAQPGYRSRHNQGYWQGEDYLGLGPSAVSTIGLKRSKNLADTARYLAQVEALGSAECEVEILRPAQVALERLALGLRTSEGVALRWLAPAARRRAQVLREEGLLEERQGFLRLTRRGRALVDAVVAELA